MPTYAGLLSDYDYDPLTHRFRKAGRYIPNSIIRRALQRYVNEVKEGDAENSVELLDQGTISIQDWVNGSRITLEETYVALYLMGLGGKRRTEGVPWEMVSRQLIDQYQRLNESGRAIARGELSRGQIVQRYGLYLQSARQMYERGRAWAFGGSRLILPAYPGDGSSECLVNCKCYWDIHDFSDRWECSWMRTAQESCPTCLQRAGIWSPYIVYK